MLRACSCRAATLEWEAITGAAESRVAASIASFEMCETSTMMPRRFISAITSAPNSLTPPCSAPASPAPPRGVAESAMSL